MIPEFPNFRKLELSDKKEIEIFVSKFPPYSAFNFTNLWAWDIKDNRQISMLNGNLVVLFSNYDSEEQFLSFLGINKCDDTVTKLLNFSTKLKISPCLRYITEETINQLHSNYIDIKEDRDNFDYIFSTVQLAKLQGIKFKNHRHLSNKFSLEYPRATFLIQDLDNLMIQNSINIILKKWESLKKIQNKDCNLKFEEIALRRLLKNASKHKLILSCVVLNDIMIGFSIDEMLPNENAMSHFIKADNSYKGIYEFLNKNIAEYLVTLGIITWNWQQDLNISNLRKTKLGYRPISFLKRYTLSFNDSALHTAKDIIVIKNDAVFKKSRN